MNFYDLTTAINLLGDDLHFIFSLSLDRHELFAILLRLSGLAIIKCVIDVASSGQKN